ncbi:MAG: histidine kinase [Flavobacteriales bacterium]|jgi:signal transduction histidine kinase/sugar lactone lactonase YvrE|nr:histidine kinase [Flavobacteriales bacterium]
MPFEQISTLQGLSDNAITKLFQDQDGFLWIGTEYGLDRYDGHHMRIWHKRDGLAGEHIVDILQTHDGTIWAAAREGGLTCFDAQGTLLRFFKPDANDPHAIADARITCLFDLDDTTLLIGAERTPLIFLDKRSGICRYWKGEGPIRASEGLSNPAWGTDWCQYITDLGDGRLAIGFLLGFKQMLVQRKTGSILGPAFNLDLPEDQTITNAVRIGNRLFGGGWQHYLHVRDLTSGQETVWPLPDECTALLAVDSVQIIAGTASSGMLQIDLRTGKQEVLRHRTGDPNSLCDDRVTALLVDRDGRLWVGTRNGLSVHAPARWWTNSIPLGTGEQEGRNINAFSIAEIGSGELLVGTTEGLFRQLPGGPMRFFPLKQGSSKLRPTGVIQVGNRFMLGAEEGLFKWDPTDNSISPWAIASSGSWDAKMYGVKTGTTPPALFQVRGMFVDTLRSRPALVMGVRGYGVATLDLKKNEMDWFVNNTGGKGGIGNNLTNALVKDRNGVYWAGTAYGLYRWDLERTTPRNAFTTFLAGIGRNSLPANEVIALLADARGPLWIGMRNGGLASWDGQSMHAFTLPEPAGNSVYGMALDRAGRLWCAARGCFAVLDTATAEWTLVPLQGASGIPGTPACTRALHDGRIAFTANGALQLFDPQEVHRPSPPPLPYLTALNLADSSVVPDIKDGVLHLGVQAGMLQVSVSALDLLPLSPLRYTLELEGVDVEPRFTDESGSIVFASLPSGRHRILARAISANGLVSQPVEVAIFDKASPLWQRWWFYWALAALAGAIAYAASRYNYRQKLKLQLVRNRIASDLHDEVGSSLSAITIGSQLAKQLGNCEDQRMQVLLSRIGSTSSESLRSMSDIVWAIDPKNDQGEALVKRMRRIANELLESKGVEVSFIVTGGVEELKLPMNARKELLLIYKEAVHNASKYAEARNVSIHLSRAHGTLSLSVKDDGKGFDHALHPDGHGLGSMQRRGTTLGSMVLIESMMGEGTRISIQVDLTRIRD